MQYPERSVCSFRGMLCYMEYGSKYMVLYAVKTSDIRSAAKDRMCDVLEALDGERRRKLSEIKHKDEYNRSVFAGLLLRYAFLSAGNTKTQWDNVEISYGRYGKPYISGMDDFHFSLSHSGGWVICAVDDVPVGADIQEERTLRLNTAKRFYSPEEYGRLLDVDGKEQKELFYRMWTAKESCVKLIGRGIGAGIDKYVTNSLFDCIYGDDGICYNIRIYDEIDDYIICVCSRRDDFPQSITNIEWERLW